MGGGQLRARGGQDTSFFFEMRGRMKRASICSARMSVTYTSRRNATIVHGIDATCNDVFKLPSTHSYLSHFVEILVEGGASDAQGPADAIGTSYFPLQDQRVRRQRVRHCA